MMNNEKVAVLTLEVTTIAYRLMEGEEVSANHPYAWLMEFDRDDLKDFVSDVSGTFHRFSGLPNAWAEVEAIVFEWHESALISASGVLDEMLNAEKPI
jgi:hypothetical protein